MWSTGGLTQVRKNLRTLPSLSLPLRNNVRRPDGRLGCRLLCAGACKAGGREDASRKFQGRHFLMITGLVLAALVLSLWARCCDHHNARIREP